MASKESAQSSFLSLSLSLIPRHDYVNYYVLALWNLVRFEIRRTKEEIYFVSRETGREIGKRFFVGRK